MTNLRTRLAQERRSRALRGEVKGLIASGDVAVLNPLVPASGASSTAREVAQDIVLDLVRTYGARKPGRWRGLPRRAVLLGHPLALLRLPSTHGEYLERVGPKTRNMIRKAAKSGYEFREFAWNDHLDEIYEVNTSREVRQGRPMQGWYSRPVAARLESEDERRFRKYYGVFREGRLYGYLHLVLCGDFGFFRHFLGHSDHLTNGVMNGLISWTVEQYVGHAAIRWFKYGALVAGNDGMSAFRRHSGFTPHAAFLNLEGVTLDGCSDR